MRRPRRTGHTASRDFCFDDGDRRLGTPASPRQQPSRRARRTTGSPRLSGRHAARGRRHPPRYCFPDDIGRPLRPKAIVPRRPCARSQRGGSDHAALTASAIASMAMGRAGRVLLRRPNASPATGGVSCDGVGLLTRALLLRQDRGPRYRADRGLRGARRSAEATRRSAPDTPRTSAPADPPAACAAAATATPTPAEPCVDAPDSAPRAP
jgi:hypothetical protein